MIKWLFSSLLLVLGSCIATYFGIANWRYRQYLAVQANAERAGFVTSLDQLRSATPIAEKDDAVPILFDTCQLMSHNFIQESRVGLSKLGLVQLTGGDQARLVPWLESYRPVFRALTDAARKPGCSFPSRIAESTALNLTSRITIADRALLVRSVYENAEHQPLQALQTLQVAEKIATDIAAQEDMSSAYAATALNLEVERQVAEILGCNKPSRTLLDEAKQVTDGISFLDPQLLLREQIAYQMGAIGNLSPVEFDRFTFSFSHSVNPGSKWVAQSEILNYAMSAQGLLAGRGTPYEKQRELAELGKARSRTSSTRVFQGAQLFNGFGRIPSDQPLVQSGKIVLEYVMSKLKGENPTLPAALSPQLPIVANQGNGVLTASVTLQIPKTSRLRGLSPSEIDRFQTAHSFSVTIPSGLTQMNAREMSTLFTNWRL